MTTTAYGKVQQRLRDTLDEIDAAGLTKRERELTTPQSAHIGVSTSDRRADALNFCANNYLGLADDPRVVAAAARGPRAVGLRDGQRALHLRHPGAARGARGRPVGVPRHGRHDLVLVLLRRQRRRLRDALRRRGRDHLRRAQPRLAHRRHPALQGRRATATGTPTWPTSRPSSSRRRTPAPAASSPTASSRWTATSRRSTRICDLAEQHDALVLVDDSHAVGFVGPNGRGTPEHFGVIDRVDIVTGTLGKALGGASGGYVAGASRDRRPAAPARPALPVLQRRRALGRGRLAGGAADRGRVHRGPRDACAATPRCSAR